MAYGYATNSESTIPRIAARWVVALAFFVALCALFASLQLFQVTSEGPSRQSLRRAIATVTEIDVLVERNYDEIQQRAATARENEELTLRDFPVHVPLTRADVQGASPEQLRELLLTRASIVMYEEGSDALLDSTEGSGGAGRFSAAGAVDTFLGFLTDSTHDRLALLTFALIPVCVGLAIALAASCRGYGRMMAVGAVMTLASAVLLASGALAWLTLQVAGGSDAEYVQREFLDIGAALAWIAVRNGMALLALAVVIFLAGTVLARWSDAQDRPQTI